MVDSINNSNPLILNIHCWKCNDFLMNIWFVVLIINKYAMHLPRVNGNYERVVEMAFQYTESHIDVNIN